MAVKQQPEAPAYSSDREKRVADALRENLRKRKVQKQAKEQADKQSEQE